VPKSYAGGIPPVGYVLELAAWVVIPVGAKLDRSGIVKRDNLTGVDGHGSHLPVTVNHGAVHT